MVVYDFLLIVYLVDGCGVASLVCADVIWQHLAPRVVGHIGSIALRTGRESGRPKRPYVVALAVIIPRENLYSYVS